MVSADNIEQKRVEALQMTEQTVNIMNKDYLYEKLAQVDIKQIEVEGDADNKIKVFVIRPKNLPITGNACEVYAHGGGACLNNAEIYNPLMTV